MCAVPDFGYALVGGLGAPKARLVTYTEIQLKDAQGKRCIPDGAIVVQRGKKTWQCLVEVKTGKAALDSDQVSRYLDWARENGFDAVLTISNQITASSSESPVSVDGRKLRRTSLYHLSWWRILTEAIVQHRHRGVEDPDQAWLLGELIAYLDHEKSGASGFQDMGDKWVSVRTAAGNQTLRGSDPEVREVAARWDQFIDYLCLGLGQDLGEAVVPVRPRKQTLAGRLDESVKSMSDTGKLHGAVRVPNAIGDLVVEADLRTRLVTTSVRVEGPGEGRPKTRITWMLRQLRNAPGDLRVTVTFANARETTSLLNHEGQETPERLLSPTDAKRNPKSFELALSRKMGTKRGKDEGSFVRETRAQAIDFYRDLVQDLRGWQASAPRLPEDRDESDAPSPEPPAFSSDGARDPGDAEGIFPPDWSLT